MATYKLDLDVLNKLTGTHIDLVNLAGGGIGLAPGLKLVLDKGSGNVADYYDSGNSRRVMTLGGSDALYLETSALNLLGRYLKNPKGFGGSAGSLVRLVDSASGLKAAIESAQNGIVWILPGTYAIDVDCKNDPISIPDNCTLIAFGAEMKFRNQNAGGYWGNKMFDASNVSYEVHGGKWWIDRANSVDDDARKLFEVRNGAMATFRGCWLSNDSGREAICATNSGTRVKCFNCFFQPQQNTYSSNQFIYGGNGASLFIDGCVFDGFYPGQTAIRNDVGIGIYPKGNCVSKISNSIFRYLKGGVGIEHWNYGTDSRFIHISGCDFVDTDSTMADYCPIYFRTAAAAAAGYNLYDVTIESCTFKGGSSAMGQIGTKRNDNGQTGIKRLVIRNCTMIAAGEYTTAKYAIDFREAGSGGTAVEIAQISNLFISSGYGTSQVNLASGIPLGKYDVTLES